MRNNKFLIFLTGLFVLICLFYLSFTFMSRSVENKAAQFATVNGKVDPFKKQAYLDSVWTEKTFLGFTYKELKEQELKLGLDLRGGMHVVMEVSAPDVLRSISGNNPDPDFQKALADAQKALSTRQGSYTDLFYDAFKKYAPNKSLAGIFANKSNQNQITFQSSDQDVLKYIDTQLDRTIDQSFEILRNRIDRFGVAQPNIQQLQGTNRIQIELPGVDNPARVRKLLQGAAKLEFYEVWEGNEFIPYYIALNDYLLKQEKAGKPNTPAAADSLSAKADPLSVDTAANTAAQDPLAADNNLNADTAQQTATAQAKKDTAKAEANSSQSSLLASLFVPAGNDLGTRVKDTAKVNALLNRPDVKALFPADMAFAWGAKPIEGTEIVSLYPIKKSRQQGAPMEGDVIVGARSDFDQFGKPEVTMQMSAKGAKAWKRLTGQNVGRRIAIVLDNVVYSAPSVQGEIAGGNSSITGSFTIEEAKDLATVLQAGKIPVPTRIVEESVVGPTLGQESINKGLLSIFIGFLVIIGFMIAYYSNSGMVANIAVLLNVLFIIGVMVAWPNGGAILTLPGIAGIVLTIGMAVDANVLINERVKDELRAGQSLLNATINGYRLASTSIWDANITTFLAGLVLFFFGSGPIKGFATTLMIGIVTSLFTSVYVTRMIAEFRLRKGKAFKYTTAFSKNLFKDTNFDFVSKRKVAYIASTVFILAGIVSMIVRGFDYGVDFKGGWTYQVEFNEAPSASDIHQALAGPLQGAPEVKTYGGASKLQITTPYLIDDLSTNAADRVEQALRKGLDSVKPNGYEIVSSAKVGPTVANDIRRSAIWAVVIAMGFIFAYIWIRFKKWQYALGATVAVIHDVLVIMTVYTLGKDLLPFTLEIDQNFIAAILTIVGFSVNDTVVVFDRVREFFKESALSDDPAKVVNKALNDTFSRTIITSSTVFLVVLILLVFGGETIRGLSFALLIGVLTGAYSTIYIAVPFVVDAYKNRKKEQLATATAATATVK